MSNKANRNPVSDSRWLGRSFKKHGERVADLREREKLREDLLEEIEPGKVPPAP